MSKTQVHSKFKFFELDFTDGKISKIDKKLFLSFLDNPKTLIKSVGVEFIEPTSKILLSFGYDLKKNTHNHDLIFKKVGSYSGILSLEAIELKMEKEALKLEHVICHEFFVDNKNDVYAIFLVLK